MHVFGALQHCHITHHVTAHLFILLCEHTFPCCFHDDAFFSIMWMPLKGERKTLVGVPCTWAFLSHFKGGGKGLHKKQCCFLLVFITAGAIHLSSILLPGKFGFPHPNVYRGWKYPVHGGIKKLFHPKYVLRHLENESFF